MDKIFRKLISVFKSKNVKYGTVTLVLIAAATAIALVLNLFVGMFDLKWDLTPNKLYSISDKSVEILKALEKDVIIYGLFDDGKVGAREGYKEFVQLLDKYERYPRIKVEYVDLDRNPDFRGEIDPDDMMEIKKGKFIVKSGDRVKVLDGYDLYDTHFDQQSFQNRITGSNAERGFTGAIVFVTAEETPVVYFTKGHGETELDRDFSNARDRLERNNYEVKTIDLLIDGIPDDAIAVVMFSPRNDLKAKERDILDEYLKDRGGNVIMLFDPILSSDKFEEFNKVLNEFNININHDRISENDRNMYLPLSQFYLYPKAESSPITSELSPSNFRIIMPYCRSVDILKNTKEYIETTSLITTSDQAESIKADGSENEIGKLNVAVAVDYKGGYKPSKLLVTGNSAFMSDEVYAMIGDSGIHFFMHLLSWMKGDDKGDFYVAPKAYERQSINITAKQSSVFSILLVVVLPIIIFGMGTYVYLRRRHL